MNPSAIRKKWIGDRAFYSRVTAIVLPFIIQNTVTNVVSLLDNVMVGMVGTIPMSSVAIVNQLLFVFNLCIFGGLSGAGIFSTQYAGAHDYRGMAHCFRIKLYTAVIMLGVALVVLVGMPQPLIGSYLAQDTSPADRAATMGYALEYLRIMLAGLFPFALAQVYSSSLREMGETRLPMIASVAAILVNLVFNYLLIFGKFGFPRLGVAGAAIATILSRYVECGIILLAAHRGKERFPFIKEVYRSWKVPGDLLKGVLVKGLPLLFNEFLWSSSLAVLLACYSTRGLHVVAAANIASTANGLFNVVFLSMGSAVSIMVGQALGAGEPERAQDIAWKLLALGVMVSVVMGGIASLAAPFIPRIYNTTPEVRSLATQLLWVLSGLMPVFSFCHCSYFIVRSGGRTGITMALDSMFSWGVSIPVALVLTYCTSLPVVPLYFTVEALNIIKSVIGYILVKKGIWVRNIVSGFEKV